jgi:hypothetical protein
MPGHGERPCFAEDYHLARLPICHYLWLTVFICKLNNLKILTPYTLLSNEQKNRNIGIYSNERTSKGLDKLGSQLKKGEKDETTIDCSNLFDSYGLFLTWRFFG